MSIEVVDFLQDPAYSAVKDYYKEKFSKVDELLNTVNSLSVRLSNLENPNKKYSTLITGNVNTITLTISDQNNDDDYTIDWGDENTSLSGNGGSITHNYSETNIYKITIINNNDDSSGVLTFGSSNIKEADINNIQLEDGGNNNIIKLTLNNQMLFSGSTYSPYINLGNNIKELYIGKNCYLNNFQDYPFIGYSQNIIKVVIDMPLILNDLYSGNGGFIRDCPNLTELHLTSITLPVVARNTLFDTIPTNLKIYVPIALVEEYKTALPDYASYIEGEYLENQYCTTSEVETYRQDIINSIGT